MIDAARPRLTDLAEIARRAMQEHGLDPDMPPEVQQELAAIPGPATDADPSIRDLRRLPWCSIDDDDSRDLAQLTLARHGAGHSRAAGTSQSDPLLVAIADGGALV